jgi:protein involved in sex pheromone biosynthesis
MIKSFQIHKIILVVLILILSGCHKYDFFNDINDDNNSDTGKKSENIVIDEDTYNAIENDEYSIVNAYIEGDSLQIKIEYGGGCGTVEYSLITDGIFMESYPVQLNITLSFKDNDTCEALIRKTTTTNLSNLADYYSSLYHNDHDTIIIHLEGYNETIIYSF